MLNLPHSCTAHLGGRVTFGPGAATAARLGDPKPMERDLWLEVIDGERGGYGSTLPVGAKNKTAPGNRLRVTFISEEVFRLVQQAVVIDEDRQTINGIDGSERAAFDAAFRIMGFVSWRNHTAAAMSRITIKSPVRCIESSAVTFALSGAKAHYEDVVERPKDQRYVPAINETLDEADNEARPSEPHEARQ